MQRFVNAPDRVVEDMLDGFVKAHPGIDFSPRNKRVVAVTDRAAGKVGLVTGGGSGHEPAFLGYLGQGMLDAVAVGEVFASPPAQVFYDAFMEADTGAGVACLFGNYAGDNMNVKMAIDMAADDGVTVKYVVATDDIASSPRETIEKRHGISGGFYMWKAAGAAAAAGASLDDVIAVAQDAVDRTRSICVGLAPLTIPAVGKPGFVVEPGTMEFGIGHHGEAGTEVLPLQTADETARLMVDALLRDFQFQSPRELSVMVSGLGATPVMEPYIIFNSVESALAENGHVVTSAHVGNFVTSLDMNGVSVTIVDLDDILPARLSAPGAAVGLASY